MIGTFCALGEGVRFIMNGANHRVDGPSTFPFPIMGGSWADHMNLLADLPRRGDTVVGNDVWLGYQAMVMPGVRIGHGAIVASGAVVVDDVPEVGVVGGNPAKLIRLALVLLNEGVDHGADDSDSGGADPRFGGDGHDGFEGAGRAALTRHTGISHGHCGGMRVHSVLLQRRADLVER